MHVPVLEMLGVSKSYGAVVALKDVSLSVSGGTIHAVLGENGAGKSTLIEILAGNVVPDSGRISIDGQPVRIDNATDARKLGIAVVHQHLALAPNLSVAENILVGRLPTRFGLIRRRELLRRAQRLLTEHRVPVDPDALVGQLPLGVRQQIEIVRALSASARVLALDEPTSSLSLAEASDLFAYLGRLKSIGTAVILITHYIDDAVRMSDQVTVLRDGQRVASLHTSSTGPDEIVQMMIGRPLHTVYPKPGPGGEVPTNPALVVRSLRSGPQVKDVTFTVKRGEIVGLYGLVGAGRSEALQAVFGLRPREGGSIEVSGRELPKNHWPSDAMAAGVALLPEDRTVEGLFLLRTLAENLFAPQLQKFGRWLLGDKSMRSHAVPYIRRFAIKGASQTLITNLSGGNQQKVLFARWLAMSPEVFMVDEPTRGVDVGTKVTIHEVMRTLADEGKAIAMVSSELPEVIGMSDRIYVFASGRTVDSCTRAEATASRLLKSASRYKLGGGIDEVG